MGGKISVIFSSIIINVTKTLLRIFGFESNILIFYSMGNFPMKLKLRQLIDEKTVWRLKRFLNIIVVR